jgi:hypothetical protein
MPISKYYKGHGSEVMSNMKKEYGDKKGKEVFYATANKKGLKAEDTEDIKENHMAAQAPAKTRIQRLIEAIKAKRWHDANVLTSRILEGKVLEAVSEERKGMFKNGFIKECPQDGDGGSPMSDNPGLKKEAAKPFGGKQAPPFGKKAVKEDDEKFGQDGEVDKDAKEVDENFGAKDAGANDKQQSHKDFLKNLKKKK